MKPSGSGQVRDCMRTEVTKVDGKLDVLSALKIMKKVRATCLIVKRRDENDETGMLLFSDIAKEVIAKNRAPERVNVYEIMSKPVIHVDPEMDIRYCTRMFENFGIGRAPVVENKRVIGIVGYTDIVLDGVRDRLL